MFWERGAFCVFVNCPSIQWCPSGNSHFYKIEIVQIRSSSTFNVVPDGHIVVVLHSPPAFASSQFCSLQRRTLKLSRRVSAHFGVLPDRKHKKPSPRQKTSWTEFSFTHAAKKKQLAPGNCASTMVADDTCSIQHKFGAHCD